MDRPGLAPNPWLMVVAVLVLLVLGRGQVPIMASALPAVFDPRFGAVEAFRARERADLVGVRWSRLVFFWHAIQPSGARSWNSGYFPDHLLRRELDSGRQIVGLLMGTPSWAGGGQPHTPPRGLNLPIDDSENHWASFVRTMAERYRGRIDHWVVWNEPDIWDPASPFYTWSGTDEQFYQLQKVAYLTVKQANPQARVALPGLTYWWDQAHDRPQFLERYLEIAARDPQAAANNWFFDAAVLHLYDEPARLYQAPLLFRQLLAARGLERPIWINETNVAPADDPANLLPRDGARATLDDQASYVVQATAWALAAGVEHLSIYPFADGEAAPAGEQMGLVRSDGSTRPAYQAYQTVTRYLLGVREARVEQNGEVVEIVLHQDGGRVTVVWSAVPRPVEVAIDATAPSARLVDKYGQVQSLSPTGNAYRLTLDPAPTSAAGSSVSPPIGGSPLLLVEP